MLPSGSGIRTGQALTGHADVATALVHTQALTL